MQPKAVGLKLSLLLPTTSNIADASVGGHLIVFARIKDDARAAHGVGVCLCALNNLVTYCCQFRLRSQCYLEAAR